MKYHVFIGKREILTAIIFIVGLIILFNGIHSTYKYNHALNLNTLEESELKDGAYVTGSIDSYVGKNLYGSNKFSGVSVTFLTSGKAYDIYTIPIGQNSYICIMAYSKSLLDRLEAFENGHGENAYFTGKIITPQFDLNLEWHASIDGFHTEDLIDSYVIKEINPERNKRIIYIGVLLIVVAVLLFFSAGGIKNIVMEETEKTRTAYNISSRIYNGDYGLRAEQMQLETLERRLHSIKRNAVLCLVLLLVGVYIIFSAYLYEVKAFGILLLLIAVKGIWKYFINSANTIAMSLVKKFNLKSLSAQIAEHKENIEKLGREENACK
ncbi:MAG: hypothetical protein NC433_15680 [Clostridiales bacterium]|nr:hypothetical protein [Clostridiales bacterium]